MLAARRGDKGTLALRGDGKRLSHMQTAIITALRSAHQPLSLPQLAGWVYVGVSGGADWAQAALAEQIRRINHKLPGAIVRSARGKYQIGAIK